MNKIIKLLMLICVFATFNCYLLHSEEIEDNLRRVILDIPEVAMDVKYWSDSHKNEQYNEFEFKAKQEIDLDGNKEPDYLVIARYQELNRNSTDILVIIKDIINPVYTDFRQYFTPPEIIENIVPNKSCLFYRGSYSHGFGSWQSRLIVLEATPRFLLDMDFSSYESRAPGAFTDEDNFKFEDLDGDGLKEVELEHIIWTYKEKKDGGLSTVLNLKEYKVFKYEANKKQLIEIQDKGLLKAASKLFVEDRKSKVYDNETDK